MRLNKITRIFFLLLIFVPLVLSAQDQRLVKTKVADALALLPATDNQQATRIFKELVGLGDEGLQFVTDGIQPNGVVAGIPFRYAVSLLTHYSTTKEEKTKIEHAYLVALKKSTNAEVKAYFMDNLKQVGSNESVAVLRNYIGDKDSYDPAISTLVAIGTDDAKKVIMDALPTQAVPAQVRLIKAIGELNYLPALASVTTFTSSDNILLKKQALWSVALLADADSYQVLFQQAKNVDFKNDPTEATAALVEYLHQMTSKGNIALVNEISKAILDNTLNTSQQQVRLAGLKALAQVDPETTLITLIKERSRFDDEYKKEVLKIAVSSASSSKAMKLWQKEYKKATDADQADLLRMLAKANHTNDFVEAMLLPALSSKNKSVRITAASEIASYRNKKYTPVLLDYLLKSTDADELASAQSVLLQVADKETDELVAQKIESAQSQNKIVLLEILAKRRAVNYFDAVVKQTSSNEALVKESAFKALPNVSSGRNMATLLTMLSRTENSSEVNAIQSAIISAIDKNNTTLVNEAYAQQKVKLLPVLPYLNDSGALEKVVSSFYQGNENEREVAFVALKNWQNQEAVRALLTIRKNESLKKYHEQALQAFISQTAKSAWPDDQKLLMLREMMTLASDKNEKIAVLRAAGDVRTFLSLMFISNYLDDAELSSVASRAAMQLALPTSDAKPGLTGTEVRKILERMLDKLTGEDSQYERIDVLTYLKNLPYTKGYESIFNEKDLSGWQGLVENPIARAKMTKEVLAKKQVEANAKVKDNWSVKDGMIVFQGDGANLCTTRPYGDFEMIVDWRISKNGDSGIYLRGSPQVQIWDIARTDVGAQVGSGGLYNNKKERSTPLVLADNPIGEWNTFYIKMIGDRVTVYLNGVLVVDDVVMENYWDRNLPIFLEEAIELQAHGTDLAFRNIYVRELGTKPYELSKEEKEQGFDLVFNGKDLNTWVGNKIDYVVEDNAIAIYPSKESHGNLFTAKEYSDFIFRFEFQLTEGANNGLGIHAPLEGDAAYVGKEIQILDNEAPVYAKLEVYQYHGSVYGVIPAKRGFLKPTGEWNQEEVYVKGDYIKVTLNGTIILEGDMKKASKNGTLDHKDHPGLNRNSGHIGFLGHGSIVKFKSIRIKDLSK
jgi:hypothetical protein